MLNHLVLPIVFRFFLRKQGPQSLGPKFVFAPCFKYELFFFGGQPETGVTYVAENYYKISPNYYCTDLATQNLFCHLLPKDSCLHNKKKSFLYSARNHSPNMTVAQCLKTVFIVER